jgi:hypothetical protein
METLRTLDQSKRGKPPEVENLIKMPSMVSNPITEKDSELLSNFGLLVPNSYQDLSNDCAEQVQFLRQWKKWGWKSLEKRRLHKILQKNSKLVFKFMILLRHKSEERTLQHQNSSSAPPYFGKLMSKVFDRLVRRKQISLPVIMRICAVLIKSNIACKSWMKKPFKEMEAVLWKTESFWLNKSACDDAERTYYEKLSGCKVASSMTENSAEQASSVLTGRLAPTANDTMIHQFIDLTI